MFGWSNCPQSIRTQIQNLVAESQVILQDNLVGVYLHGSLAMDCFNVDNSDIDLIVLTRDAISLENKKKIASMLVRLSNSPAPIEISFLSREMLKPWEFPTPFDLHYGETLRTTYEHDLTGNGWKDWNSKQEYDPDLAGHILVLLERGICVFGASISASFPEIPQEDYLASVTADVKDALESFEKHPTYAVLNSCRTLAYLENKKVLSKREGGQWELLHLPAKFNPLVAQALENYCGSASQTKFEIQLFDPFSDYVQKQLAGYTI